MHKCSECSGDCNCLDHLSVGYAEDDYDCIGCGCPTSETPNQHILRKDVTKFWRTPENLNEPRSLAAMAANGEIVLVNLSRTPTKDEAARLERENAFRFYENCTEEERTKMLNFLIQFVYQNKEKL